MILLLILTSSIGAAFYRLAHDHYRKEWPFALLGGGVFLVSYILYAFILGIVLALTGNVALLESVNALVFEVIIYALAGITGLILYLLLKKNWKNNPKNQKENSKTIDNF